MDRAHQNMKRNEANGRWRRESRLAMAAFIFFSAICLAWMLPWTPSGLSPSDYSPELIFTMFLLGGSAVTGILAFVLRDVARRDLARVAALGEFYDEATGMNNRFFLLDRLAARVERARRTENTFALMIVRVAASNRETNAPIPLSGAILHEVGQAIGKAIRRGDLVATLGDSEFAIVADDFQPDRRNNITSRLETALREAVAGAFDQDASVSITTGIATFPTDGAQPDALIAAALDVAFAEPAAA